MGILLGRLFSSRDDDGRQEEFLMRHALTRPGLLLYSLARCLVFSPPFVHLK